jgi:hypothetical protein
MDALLAAAETSLREGDEPRTKLRAFVRAHMRLYATSQAKHLLLINELGSLPSRGRAAIVAKQRKLVGLAADLFAAVAPALNTQPDLRFPTAMSFYGMINWTCIWYRPDGTLSPDEFADLASDLFLDGLAGRFGSNTLSRTGKPRSG